MRRRGEVVLVGAGPGAAGLMTLAGRETLASADVVVHDALVDASVLALASPAAKRIYAGKRAGQHRFPQDRIHQILVSHARRGLSVVRLKGGDPFVFGRGGEEAEACRRAGVPFRIIPGVSSGNAVPACAGIPVKTRKGFAPLSAGLAGAIHPGVTKRARPAGTSPFRQGRGCPVGNFPFTVKEDTLWRNVTTGVRNDACFGWTPYFWV